MNILIVDSLQDLMRELHGKIKNSDWLKENTAEKWTAENPELAREYLAAASKGQPSWWTTYVAFEFKTLVNALSIFLCIWRYMAVE